LKSHELLDNFRDHIEKQAGWGEKIPADTIDGMGPGDAIYEHCGEDNVVNPSRAMDEVVRYCAWKFANNPMVRKWCRERFRKRVAIWTSPTKQAVAKKMITPAKKYYGVTRVFMRPLCEYVDKENRRDHFSLAAIEALRKQNLCEVNWGLQFFETESVDLPQDDAQNRPDVQHKCQPMDKFRVCVPGMETVRLKDFQENLAYQLSQHRARMQQMGVKLDEFSFDSDPSLSTNMRYWLRLHCELQGLEKYHQSQGNQQWMQDAVTLHDDPLFAQACQLYCYHAAMEVVEDEWNKYRKDVVKTALVEFLYPRLFREYYFEAVGRQQQLVMSQVAALMKRNLDKIPRYPRFTPSGDELAHLEEIGYDQASKSPAMKTREQLFDEFQMMTVVGVAPDPGDDWRRLNFSVLDPFGHVLTTTGNYRYVGTKDPSQLSDPDAQVVAEKEKKKFFEIMDTYSPAFFMVVGSGDCNRARRGIADWVNAFAEQKEYKSHAEVMVVRPEIPAAISSHKHLSSEGSMHRLSPAFRLAACAGRFGQNPMAEALRLWNQDESQPNAFLTVPWASPQLRDEGWHGLQLSSTVPRATMESFLRSHIQMHVCSHPLLTRINVMRRCPELQAPLQFVPGMGPARACSFIKRLRKMPTMVRSRQELKEFNLLPECVFNNASAFLAITPDPFTQVDKYSVENWYQQTALALDRLQMCTTPGLQNAAVALVAAAVQQADLCDMAPFQKFMSSDEENEKVVDLDGLVQRAVVEKVEEFVVHSVNEHRYCTGDVVRYVRTSPNARGGIENLVHQSSYHVNSQHPRMFTLHATGEDAMKGVNELAIYGGDGADSFEHHGPAMDLVRTFLDCDWVSERADPDGNVLTGSQFRHCALQYVQNVMKWLQTRSSEMMEWTEDMITGELLSKLQADLDWFMADPDTLEELPGEHEHQLRDDNFWRVIDTDCLPEWKEDVEKTNLVHPWGYAIFDPPLFVPGEDGAVPGLDTWNPMAKIESHYPKETRYWSKRPKVAAALVLSWIQIRDALRDASNFYFGGPDGLAKGLENSAIESGSVAVLRLTTHRFNVEDFVSAKVVNTEWTKLLHSFLLGWRQFKLTSKLVEIENWHGDKQAPVKRFGLLNPFSVDFLNDFGRPRALEPVPESYTTPGEKDEKSAWTRPRPITPLGVGEVSSFDSSLPGYRDYMADSQGLHMGTLVSVRVVDQDKAQEKYKAWAEKVKKEVDEANTMVFVEITDRGVRLSGYFEKEVATSSGGTKKVSEADIDWKEGMLALCRVVKPVPRAGPQGVQLTVFNGWVRNALVNWWLHGIREDSKDYHQQQATFATLDRCFQKCFVDRDLQIEFAQPLGCIADSELKKTSLVGTERSNFKYHLAKSTVHDNFRNVSQDELLKQLEGMPEGTTLFRAPRTANDGTLMAFIKLLHPMNPSDIPKLLSLKHTPTFFYKHYTIEIEWETERAREGVSSVSKRTYVIDGQRYQDLDHVLAGHCELVYQNFCQLVNHHKFQKGNPVEYKEQLVLDAKSKLSALGPEHVKKETVKYGITWHHRFMGLFAVTWLNPSEGRGSKFKAHTDVVDITPQGFKVWLEGPFETVDRMIRWWQREGCRHIQTYSSKWLEVMNEKNKRIKVRRQMAKVQLEAAQLEAAGLSQFDRGSEPGTSPGGTRTASSFGGSTGPGLWGTGAPSDGAQSEVMSQWSAVGTGWISPGTARTGTARRTATAMRTARPDSVAGWGTASQAGWESPSTAGRMTARQLGTATAGRRVATLGSMPGSGSDMGWDSPGSVADGGARRGVQRQESANWSSETGSQGWDSPVSRVSRRGTARKTATVGWESPGKAMTSFSISSNTSSGSGWGSPVDKTGGAGRRTATVGWESPTLRPAGALHQSSDSSWGSAGGSTGWDSPRAGVGSGSSGTSSDGWGLPAAGTKRKTATIGWESPTMGQHRAGTESGSLGWESPVPAKRTRTGAGDFSVTDARATDSGSIGWESPVQAGRSRTGYSIDLGSVMDTGTSDAKSTESVGWRTPG